MGVYSTINIPCPKCGQLYPAQSKSGECNMETYKFPDVPFNVLSDINRHAPFKCDCGAVFQVEFNFYDRAQHEDGNYSIKYDVKVIEIKEVEG